MFHIPVDNATPIDDVHPLLFIFQDLRGLMETPMVRLAHSVVVCFLFY